MAKSPKNRHHAERILSKWQRLGKLLGHPGISEESLSFGKTYKQDPFDCGNPNCQVCHRDKVFRAPKDNTVRDGDW